MLYSWSLLLRMSLKKSCFLGIWISSQILMNLIQDFIIVFGMYENDDIFCECCSWHKKRSFSTMLNMTNIAFIPKGDVQKTTRDWRPISLCNVFDNLLSKILENRLKVTLPKCISDNLSLCYGSIDTWQHYGGYWYNAFHEDNEKKGNEECVVIKLNISKACDNIDFFGYMWQYWLGLLESDYEKYGIFHNNGWSGR